jgi:K(+)-stimulated pyrophosphate-energized sodium pump
VGDVAGMGADLFGSAAATVLAAMVLGNYVIKDMEGRIDDAFGVSGRFYYQWQLPVLVSYSPL